MSSGQNKPLIGIQIAIEHVTERGITVTRSKDGDRFYTRWESILKTTKRYC